MTIELSFDQPVDLVPGLKSPEGLFSPTFTVRENAWYHISLAVGAKYVAIYANGIRVADRRSNVFSLSLYDTGEEMTKAPLINAHGGTLVSKPNHNVLILPESGSGGTFKLASDPAELTKHSLLGS
jgi:hypothetical protein